MRIASHRQQRGPMTNAFVDTDVVVRLLTGDDPVKQQAAEKLFSAVEQGEQSLLAPDTIIADAVYVLASARLYHISRPDIRDMLVALVRLPNFRIENKSSVLRALELFGATNVDFGDAMIVASMQHAGVRNLYSYDRDFDQMDGVVRSDPSA